MLGGEQFGANEVGVDVGEAPLQGGLAVEERFEVERVGEVFDQRGVGNHRLEESADRIAAGSTAKTPVKIPEKPFENVVGSLGLDEPGAVGSGKLDGVGEEFFGVLVDLGNQAFPVWNLGIVGAGDEVFAKGQNGLLDRTDGQRFVSGVEARGTAGLGDAHGAAQLVKDFDFCLEGGD